jgi:pyruvate formate lyase activating enzyme
MGFLVKLDSNGSVPEMLEHLLREKLLDYVAMDIKNAPSRYAETCGADVIEQVEKSAALLKNSNIDYEFRTTVCHPFHSPDGMQEIGRWLHGAKRYFIQPFVDSGNLLGSGVSVMTKSELEMLLNAVKPYIPAAELRGV